MDLWKISCYSEQKYFLCDNEVMLFVHKIFAIMDKKGHTFYRTTEHQFRLKPNDEKGWEKFHIFMNQKKRDKNGENH
jgi:hypothetical protein